MGKDKVDLKRPVKYANTHLIINLIRRLGEENNRGKVTSLYIKNKVKTAVFIRACRWEIPSKTLCLSGGQVPSYEVSFSKNRRDSGRCSVI